MELNLPQEVTCPLCRDEAVHIQENKNGRPHFLCQTFGSPVNMRGDETERTEFLAQFVPDDEGDDEQETDVEEPDADESDQSDDSEGETTMADLIGGDDE